MKYIIIKHIFIIFTILTLSYQVYSQEKQKNKAIGIILANFNKGYGMTYACQYKFHEIRLNAQFVNKEYYYDFGKRLTLGKTNGYAAGIDYMYSLYNKSSWYTFLIMTGYLYRQSYAESHIYAGDTYTYKYDQDDTEHEIILGFVNRLRMYHSISINIIPRFGYYHSYEKESNMREIYDYYNTIEISPQVKEKWLLRVGLDISVEYCF
ncbi:MAG: hypothetical protein ACOCWB_01700 [Bacteroidota bacterium]